MNPFVNHESHSPTGQFSSQEVRVSKVSHTQESKETAFLSQAVEAQTSETKINREQPIPEPSHPRQYRAIGLVEGKYQRSEAQFNRGCLVTSDGAVIEAVILGRVMSLFKKYIDIEQSHLWVVYPRTRPDNDNLHLQIVGVWEPETLSQECESTQVLSETTTEGLGATTEGLGATTEGLGATTEGLGATTEGLGATTEGLPLQDVPKIENGYFSVRGEVIFTSTEREIVIVKIRQSAKKETKKTKFFKLKLQGTLPDKPINHFWNLQVRLQKDNLIIEKAQDLGFTRKKTPFQNKRKPFQSKEPKKHTNYERPIISANKENDQSTTINPPKRRFIPRPIQLFKKKPD